MNPVTNTGSVFYEDLTGTSDWTELTFDDLMSGGTATSVPLLLSQGATTTFNGWEISGAGGARQLDDLSMQLYPYLNTMGYALSDPMQFTGLSGAAGSSMAGPAFRPLRAGEGFGRAGAVGTVVAGGGGAGREWPGIFTAPY